MEIAGIKVAAEQLRNAIVVVYSVIVIATIIPGFATVSNLIILPYFILVPGYFVALILRNTGTLLETFFYTIAGARPFFSPYTPFRQSYPAVSPFPSSWWSPR